MATTEFCNSEQLDNLAFDEPTKSYKVSVVNLLAGVAYDAVTVLYPDAVTEQYEFRIGGKTGTINAIVELIYTNGSREDLVSAERISP